MRIRMVAMALATACLVVLSSPAQGAEIRVLCSNGVKAVLEELEPQFARASGHTLKIEFSSTATLKQRIEGGEAFDVAVLTTETVDDLIKSGHVSSRMRTILARVGVGVGVRQGTPKPDVRTAAGIEQALLKAGSIAFTRDGASRPHIDRMFVALGIMEALKPKIRLAGAGQGAEMVAKGEADIVLTLVSEILPIAGVELAGPLPAEFQSYVEFAASPALNLHNAAAVDALIKFMNSASAAATYRTKGMEPR